MCLKMYPLSFYTGDTGRHCRRPGDDPAPATGHSAKHALGPPPTTYTHRLCKLIRSPPLKWLSVNCQSLIKSGLYLPIIGQP